MLLERIISSVSSVSQSESVVSESVRVSTVSRVSETVVSESVRVSTVSRVSETVVSESVRVSSVNRVSESVESVLLTHVVLAEVVFIQV